ncbi:hypothetical protein CWE15_10275 [Aliidiomarina taiwanensis]|uniref:Uncharacterized protein n=1 Tax=Aliidiomarina taiwanensis TaxID=946228 RepID=A0A432WYM7_9GAMM|nr:hypothetical protein [Aliidiomarina taiwanensis]RUO38883.1 hypothetical protein CWE15_10275 [Aliidiomarina taiwanensis]
MNSKINIGFEWGLKTGYVFVLLPLTLLVLVKTFVNESLSQLILAPDWSLASTLVLGQLAARMSNTTSKAQVKVNHDYAEYHVAKRIFGVVISSSIYLIMLIKPSYWLGGLQLFVFVYASIVYFSDSRAIKMLDARRKQVDS